MEKHQHLAITKIKNSSGQWLTTNGDIRDHAIQFFQLLFQVEPQNSNLVEAAANKFLSFVPT